ncbi:hypothetical protein BGX31_009512 [Mortierella sp. GBA43]|nr:hypothetical protein BGX31_009512 [Mortierella sp. GBA43]
MNDLTGMYWDDNGNIVDSTAEYHHSLLNDFTISALFNHPTEDIDCHAQTEGWDLESTEADVVATPMSLSSEANTMMDRSKALFNQARCHLRRRDTIPDDSNRSDHDIGTPHSNTPPTIHLPTDSHIQSVSPTSDYKKDEVKTKDMPIIDLTTDTNQQNRQPSEASDKTEELDGEHKIPDMESDTLIRRLTERVRRLEEQLMQKEDMSESMYSHQCRPGPIDMDGDICKNTVEAMTVGLVGKETVQGEEMNPSMDELDTIGILPCLGRDHSADHPNMDHTKAAAGQQVMGTVVDTPGWRVSTPGHPSRCMGSMTTEAEEGPSVVVKEEEGAPVVAWMITGGLVLMWVEASKDGTTNRTRQMIELSDLVSYSSHLGLGQEGPSIST